MFVLLLAQQMLLSLEPSPWPQEYVLKCQMIHQAHLYPHKNCVFKETHENWRSLCSQNHTLFESLLHLPRNNLAWVQCVSSPPYLLLYTHKSNSWSQTPELDVHLKHRECKRELGHKLLRCINQFCGLCLFSIVLLILSKQRYTYSVHWSVCVFVWLTVPS